MPTPRFVDQSLNDEVEWKDNKYLRERERLIPMDRREYETKSFNKM